MIMIICRSRHGIGRFFTVSQVLSGTPRQTFKVKLVSGSLRTSAANGRRADMYGGGTYTIHIPIEYIDIYSSCGTYIYIYV